MKHYATDVAITGSFYVYRVKRYKVMARGLSKRDAQLIARGLNMLAEKDAKVINAIRYVKRFGPMR